jgi:ankyrin repeat protein
MDQVVFAPLIQSVRASRCPRKAHATRYKVDEVGPRGSTALIMAVVCNVPDAVSALLAVGANPSKEALDYDSREAATVEQAVFPLAAAARSGNNEIIEQLLGANADVNQQLKCVVPSYAGRKSRGMTAMHFASAYGNESTITTLLERGADLSIKGEDDQSSPLAKAVSKGFTSVVTMLVKAGCDPNAQLYNPYDDTPGNRTMLILAIHGGHVNTAAELIALGAKVNAPHQILSPLVAACAHGNTAMVDLLLTQKADPNHISTALGRTALLVATRSNYLPIVELLASHGANLSQAYVGPEHNRGISPIHLAAKFGYVRLIQVFLALGVDPNAAKTTNGYTPLLFATQYGRHFIMYLLLISGANPDEQSNRGLIPIHNAAHRGDMGMIFMLASFGANRTISINGQDACTIATVRGKQKCATWLNAVKEWSTLRIAISCRQRFAIKYLLSHSTVDPDREGGLMSSATSLVPSNLPVCKHMVSMVKTIRAGWRIMWHPLFHAGFQEAIHTICLVKHRLTSDNQLPHMPPEMWHYMCKFLGRTDFDLNTI